MRKHSFNLTDLDLSCNRLDIGITPVLEAVTSNITLTSLNLHGNTMSAASVAPLCAMIAGNTTLASLT